MKTKICLIVLALLLIKAKADLSDIKINNVGSGSFRVTWNDSNWNSSVGYLVRYHTCHTSDYYYRIVPNSPAIIENVKPKTCYTVSVKTTTKCTDCECDTWTKNTNIETITENSSEANGCCQPCKPPFVQLDFTSSCFLFVFEKLKYVQAAEACRKRGSHLTILDGEHKNEIVKRYIIRTFGESFHWWFGAVLENRTRWMWESNGISLGFKDWAPGEPNNLGKECGLLWPHYKYKWVDWNCETRSTYYICEKNI